MMQGEQPREKDFFIDTTEKYFFCECNVARTYVNGKCTVCGGYHTEDKMNTAKKRAMANYRIEELPPGRKVDGEFKGGLRLNKNKPDYTQIDFESLIPMVNTLMFGEKKYDFANWKKGGDKFTKREILKSLLRHVTELNDAVNNGTSEMDEESQEHLIGNVMCNGMFYAFHHVFKNKNYDADAVLKMYLERKEKMQR